MSHLKVKICVNQKNGKYENDKRLGEVLLVPIGNLMERKELKDV